MDESVVKEFEQQQVGKLKMSAAIRIGAKMRPQCKYQWYKDGASCVIGAAFEGIGMREIVMAYIRQSDNSEPHLWIMEYFGLRDWAPLWKKNDSGESRESIADWLESQGY